MYIIAAQDLALPLSICGVLVVIVGIAAGVGCLMGYKHVKLKRVDKARRTIIKDLEERSASITSSDGK